LINIKIWFLKLCLGLAKIIDGVLTLMTLGLSSTTITTLFFATKIAKQRHKRDSKRLKNGAYTISPAKNLKEVFNEKEAKESGS